MALPSPAELSLISWLASRTRAQWSTLANLRGLTPNDSRGLTTAARRLQEPDNVAAALADMHREDLLVLRSVGNSHSLSGDVGPLELRGLVDTREESPQLLCERTYLEILEEIDASASAPEHPPAPELSAGEAVAAATATWASMCQLDELVQAIAETTVSAKDGVANATGVKNLSAELGGGYDIERLISVALHAQLIASVNGVLVPTEKGTSWQSLDIAQKWVVLATSWWATAPWWLRHSVSMFPASSWSSPWAGVIKFHFPLAHSDEALQEWDKGAELVGLLRGRIPTPWARALWDESTMPAKDPAELLAASLPEVAPGVYANEDFTFLASGPLSSTLRLRMDTLAVRELGGLIPRYRLTGASLMRALHRGVAAADILPQVRQASLNPVPPSVEALIDDVTRKAHDRELRTSPAGTVISLANPELAAELLRDPALVVLGLQQVSDQELQSSWPIERVLHTLMGCSYLALIVDEAGIPVSPPTSEVHPEVNEGSDALEHALDELCATIEESARLGVPPGFGSIIEVATKSKTPLEIDVTMPDGTTVTHVMEPRSLTGGRLRGVEIKNSIERTLPISRITSVRPAPLTTE
ncbi:MAG: hypothetical protein HOJ70_01385 [Microbacteriaceae bacterium]|nr:hypothetical protein [Microbacteriaceae bacterium]